MIDRVYQRPGDQMMAPCGLDCSGCEAYTATQSGDVNGLEAMAEKWRQQFNLPNVPTSAFMCDGCTTEGKRLSGYCSQCDIRACAIGRGVLNCAHCPEYPCQKLEAFLAHAPEAQHNLEEVHRWLR